MATKSICSRCKQESQGAGHLEAYVEPSIDVELRVRLVASICDACFSKLVGWFREGLPENKGHLKTPRE